MSEHDLFTFYCTANCRLFFTVFNLQHDDVMKLCRHTTDKALQWTVVLWNYAHILLTKHYNELWCYVPMPMYHWLRINLSDGEKIQLGRQTLKHWIVTCFQFKTVLFTTKGTCACVECIQTCLFLKTKTKSPRTCVHVATCVKFIHTCSSKKKHQKHNKVNFIKLSK